MHKIWLIIQREYLVRVRKKSFIIMTLLGPILLASIMIVPIWLATISDTTDTIAVLDESGLFKEAFKNNSETKYVQVSGPLENQKAAFLTSDYTALLYIPELDLINRKISGYIPRRMWALVSSCSWKASLKKK